MEPVMVQIADGNQGVAETVAQMWVRILTYSPFIRSVAESILAHAQYPRSSFTQAGALYEWTRAHLVYTRDHLQVEELHGPERLIRRSLLYGHALGDCDDYTEVLGALLVHVGIPFEIVTTSSRDDGEYNHVFLVIQTDQGRIAADAIGGQPFGWRVPTTVTAWERYPMPERIAM